MIVCECCGNVPVVGTRYSKGVDGGANLNVCHDCKTTEYWDLCNDCGRDIDDCICEENKKE